MFKQQILDALKAKFQGVSDAILSRIADKLVKTVQSEEQVTTAVEGVTFQQVLESYGDSRATEAQQTAVRNYETKHGLKDGVKVEPGGQPQNPKPGAPEKPGEATPSWAQAIIDSNKVLTDRLNAIEGERLTATRRQKIQSITEKLPENLRKAYDRTPVDKLSDEEFATLVGEIDTEVQGIVSDSRAKGAVFGRPSAQNGRTNKDELSQEQKDAIAKRDGIAGDNQPF